MSALILEAKKFAICAHRGVDQRRKYTNEPYEVHPFAVAKIVKEFGGSDEMIAAALLHDTVEDTPTTIEDIIKNFGKLVSVYVSGLTDVAKPEDGNRAKRLMINNRHIGEQCSSVKTIKLADRIDNVYSIYRHDKKFSRTYFEETRNLLPYLAEGNKQLYATLSLFVGQDIK